MQQLLYNPFSNMEFDNNRCFLTGVPVDAEHDLISVFPDWLLERYQLSDKTFSMLGDGNKITYQDLKVPCSPEIYRNKILPLEIEIRTAFETGYAGVKNLPEDKLFLWLSKTVYSILYNDIRKAKRMEEKMGQPFSLSPFLENKFIHLHAHLQSLVLDIRFDAFQPYSIYVSEIKISKDIFNYKDETNNLNASLAMADFGIVACLQDNGVNKKFHKDLLSKVDGKCLHPIQFEELCAWFIYSNYLLKKYPDYLYATISDGSINVSSDVGVELLEDFKPWDDEMFAQVLANYWKPWGIALKDIYEFPNDPISFLISARTLGHIPMEDISLPY